LPRRSLSEGGLVTQPRTSGAHARVLGARTVLRQAARNSCTPAAAALVAEAGCHLQPGAWQPLKRGKRALRASLEAVRAAARCALRAAPCALAAVLC
jgi:hypothetical protein